MSSFFIEVAPGLFVADDEAAIAYYKSLQNHHARQQFIFGNLVSQVEKEVEYKKQIEQLKENTWSPKETLECILQDLETAQTSGLEGALESTTQPLPTKCPTPPMIKLSSPECYDTLSNQENEILDCKPSPVQAQIFELETSLDGGSGVALPTVVPEVKQFCLDSNSASESTSPCEIIVTENECEPVNQADVVSAVTGDDKDTPAAIEQSHDKYYEQSSAYEAYHEQPSEYEDDMSFDEDSDFDADADAFFDSCDAEPEPEPALNPFASVFVPTFLPTYVPASVLTQMEPMPAKNVASETDEGTADYTDSQDEAPFQEVLKQPIEVSKCAEEPINPAKQTSLASTEILASKQESVPITSDEDVEASEKDMKPVELSLPSQSENPSPTAPQKPVEGMGASKWAAGGMATSRWAEVSEEQATKSFDPWDVPAADSTPIFRRVKGRSGKGSDRTSHGNRDR